MAFPPPAAAAPPLPPTFPVPLQDKFNPPPSEDDLDDDDDYVRTMLMAQQGLAPSVIGTPIVDVNATSGTGNPPTPMPGLGHHAPFGLPEQQGHPPFATPPSAGYPPASMMSEGHHIPSPEVLRMVEEGRVDEGQMSLAPFMSQSRRLNIVLVVSVAFLVFLALVVLFVRK